MNLIHGADQHRTVHRIIIMRGVKAGHLLHAVRRRRERRVGNLRLEVHERVGGDDRRRVGRRCNGTTRVPACMCMGGRVCGRRPMRGGVACYAVPARGAAPPWGRARRGEE